ncbi:MAG TPA: class I SAM-dependent methyltransferase [Micavibrio sp.]|nr:class I SAM-dependent methyltransferase [Micavibrio sp.]
MNFIVVQTAFDLWARSYDADAALRAGWVAHEKVAQAVCAHKPALPVRHAVDLGTGTGLVLSYLKNEFAAARLTGVDLSVKMLEECRKKALAHRLVQHNLAQSHWPLNEGGAQVVTASGVLEFVRDSAGSVKNAAAILQKGGLAVITHQPPHIGKKPPIGSGATFSHLPSEMADSFTKAGMGILEHNQFAAYRCLGSITHYGLIAAHKLG